MLRWGGQDNIILYKTAAMKKKDLNRLKTKILTNIKTFCIDTILKDYAAESIDDANYIIVVYDMENRQQKSLRGFVNIVSDLEDDDGHKYLYIDLICNATKSITTRSNKLELGGKIMLEKVEELARALKCKYIKLKSLESVITYYHKFGWRFITKCKYKENIKYTYGVKSLYKLLKSSKTTSNHLEQSQEYLKILKIFSPFLEEYYSSRNMIYVRNANNTESTLDKYKEDLRSGGFIMIKCLEPLTTFGKKKSKKRIIKKVKRSKRNSI